MTFTERYLRYEYRYLAGLLTLILIINGAILATSIIMEANRANVDLPAWQPFLWEYSSALAALVMALFVYRFDRLFPLNWSVWRRNIWLHVIGSLIFSAGHILLMVGLRKLVMRLLGSHYDFGNIPVELLYEYRKDAWTYAILVGLFYVHRFIISRLRGEARIIDEGENDGETDTNKIPDRLLVKKLGKEFIIKVADVEWLEAAGNYVNLHINGKIYPLKTTLSRLTKQLENRGFMRIHRSYGVNLDQVDSIKPLESGDATVKLKNDVSLTLSRRYREEFRARLGI